jgi:hypothetical protein
VQRRLYELTHLTVRLHLYTQEATITIKTPSRQAAHLAAAAQAAAGV